MPIDLHHAPEPHAARIDHAPAECLPEVVFPGDPDDPESILEWILTSDLHPFLVARALGVSLAQLTAFLTSDFAKERLEQIEAVYALRKQHADRRADIAAKETLARLSAFEPKNPLEVKAAQIQLRAASALLRSLKPPANRRSNEPHEPGAQAPGESTTIPPPPDDAGSSQTPNDIHLATTHEPRAQARGESTTISPPPDDAGASQTSNNIHRETSMDDASSNDADDQSRCEVGDVRKDRASLRE